MLKNPCSGVRKDLQRRLPHYISDWVDVLSMKILSSTLFIFFTSVAPSITFALYMADSTNDELGAIEILLATGITGCWMSFFSGQPLVIVGVTGPVTILTASIYSLSKSIGVKFLPFYAWAQLWAAAMHIFLACMNACDAVVLVTRFSCETFGILIAIIYIYTGLEGIAKFLSNESIEFSSALLQLILALGTVYIAQKLSHAKRWTLFNEHMRSLISDYGATFAVFFFTVVPYLTGHRLRDPIPTLFIPTKFATTSGRAWLIDLNDIPIYGIFAAIFPGIIITILFFFDHNVSSLIAQSPEMKLKKGHAFHWDFLVLGFGMLPTALLGLPPTNGLIPQAPLHTKSLIEKKRIIEDGILSDKFEVVKVHEQRMTNLLQSILCLIVCIEPFSIGLRKIPTSVLYGLFLYLGISAFEENQFANRMKIWFMESTFYINNNDEFPFMKHIKLNSIHKFTFLQFLFCSIIFGITFTPAGVIFPILIGLLVFIRLYLFPQIFTEMELSYLDAAVVSTTDNISEMKFEVVDSNSMNYDLSTTVNIENSNTTKENECF